MWQLFDRTEKKYIQEISNFVEKIYQNLFDSEKKLKIFYKSCFNLEKVNSLSEIQEAFWKEITKKREKEIQYSFSMLGPHKDDFIFLLEGEDAKLYASQGEKNPLYFLSNYLKLTFFLRINKSYLLF